MEYWREVIGRLLGPLEPVGGELATGQRGHFSRAFRAAYGVPPAEYRRLGGTP